ncbi:MAG: hypothetical protein Q9207_001932 [Kuettlingeria erythrocarpa]
MPQAPFLYDHPSRYSFTGPTDKAWDPKAVTRASLAASIPSPPRPKQEGPLIDAKDFNRHPDSYFVVPYGNLNWKPMSPRTKKKVQYVRHAQLFLRICELLAGLGLLFCIICIKGTEGTVGWIIRVPAGVAILHTIYAIYHLARSAIARTPASTASYMIFAAILDAGLIPFLVFTAIFARDQYLEPSSTPGHWASLFMFDTATHKIVETTYLVSVVSGALHLVSLLISLYLAVLFRKISRLPPDMNPLEDNLTSRHKRNKSDLLDNRTSQTTTAMGSKRDSRVEEPFISPARSIPFMHTRNDSSVEINNVPHPHFSPRTSRTNISAPLYDQVAANRTSRNLTTPRPHTLYSQPTSHQASQSNLNSTPNPTTQNCQHEPFLPPDEPTLLRSPTKSSSVYTDDIASTRPTSTRPPSTRPFSTAPSLPPPSERSDCDNWITHPSPPPSPPIELKHLRQSNPYQPLPQQAASTSTSPHRGFDGNRTPRPLEMNPPTPVDARFDNVRHGYGRVREAGTTIDQRALMPRTRNTLGLTRDQQQLNYNPPMRKEIRQGGGYGGELGGAKAGNRGGSYGYPQERGGGRVISRSGVEYSAGGDGMGRGMRVREVSGKVVEEGRSVGHERGYGLAR